MKIAKLILVSWILLVPTSHGQETIASSAEEPGPGQAEAQRADRKGTECTKDAPDKAAVAKGATNTKGAAAKGITAKNTAAKGAGANNAGAGNACAMDDAANAPAAKDADVRVRTEPDKPALPVSQQTSDPKEQEKYDNEARQRELQIGEAVALGLVLLVAIWLLIAGTRLLGPKRLDAAGKYLAVRKHWGGFGGDSSGWQFSVSLGTCIVGVILVTVGASLAAGALCVLHDHEWLGHKQGSTNLSAKSAPDGSQSSSQPSGKDSEGAAKPAEIKVNFPSAAPVGQPNG